MKVDRVLRIIIAFFIFLAFVLALAATLFVTESALNVWDRLRVGPAWIFYAYLFAVSLLAMGAAWLVWRYVVPRRIRSAGENRDVFVTRETLEKRLEGAEARGVDTAAARAELDSVANTDSALNIIVFGEISTGKSTLIETLLPDADVSVSPVGGSTRELSHFVWKSPVGVSVVLIDAPGLGGVEDFDRVVLEEAMRSHIVIFVCDEDLNRQEKEALRRLLEVGKPTVIALNKSDRFSTDDLAAVVQRIHGHAMEIAPDARVSVAPVVAGGAERILELDKAGHEYESTRERQPNISQLVIALNHFARQDPAMLQLLRERAVFQLVAEKLTHEETLFQQRRSQEIIRSYTKKAVVGALAAVTPGADIVIQGYLGTGLTRDLCSLYGQSARDLDVEKFLNLSQSRVGRALPLTLAVAGNGLKSFPGVGTLAGGLVHAVAYGLIFDALGRSLANTLASGKGFSPENAAEALESSLTDELEAGVKRVALLALPAKVEPGQRGNKTS